MIQHEMQRNLQYKNINAQSSDAKKAIAKVLQHRTNNTWEVLLVTTLNFRSLS